MLPLIDLIDTFNECYLCQHECTHHKRVENSDKAENGRWVEGVDARYVTSSKESQQQKENLFSTF